MTNFFEFAEHDDVEGLKQFLQGEEGQEEENKPDINQVNKDTETILHIAAKNNSVKVIRFLLKQNFDINVLTENKKESPIFYTIDENNKDAFKFLIRQGANINLQNADGETPLEIATRKNLSDFVQILIKKGAKINTKDAKGKTPFDISLDMDLDDSDLTAVFLAEQAIDIVDKMGALIVDNSPKPPRAARNYDEDYSQLFEYVAQNDADSLRECLDGVDVNMQFFDGETLLHCAAENDSIECANVLLQSGANINIQRATYGDNALTIAIELGLEHMVRFLLENGASMDIPNAEGESALFTAIKSGYYNIVEIMCDNHVNLNALNDAGYTPLQEAILLHDTRAALLLLEKGASASLGSNNSYALAMNSGEFDICNAIRDKDPALARQATRSQLGSRPNPPQRVYSMMRNRDVNGLKRVLRNQYDLNGSPVDGNPLFKAIESGSLDVVKLLINAGADVETVINDESALAHACKLGHLDIVQYLMTQGADPRAENSEGETSLFAAIRSGNQQVIAEILSVPEIDINQPDGKGLTPLYIAVGLKNIPVIKQLLASGADPNITGHSPLKLAQDMKNQQIISLLLNRGARRPQPRTPRMTRLQESFLSKTGKPVIVTPFGKKQKILSRAATPLSAPEEKCYICGSKRNLVKLVPCGHHCCCWNCSAQFANQYTQCPLCQLNFFATKKD